jgi:YHS domain-containing protein
MNFRLTVFSSLFFVLALASCETNAPNEMSGTVPAPETKESDINSSILSDNMDHVCGMTVQTGSIADTTTYNGKVYGFCSTECKEAFVKEPQTYLTQK